ncbi:MAG: hypothetical protein WCP65_04425 [Bacteroidota bacterium]
MQKKITGFILLVLFLWMAFLNANAQCSICTKTASQLGEGPAHALNTAIVYLMLTPFAIIGFIGYRWWKSQKSN